MDKLINLEDAIEEIAKHDTTDGTVKVFSGREVIEMLKDLPSVQPDVPDTNVGELISRTAAIDTLMEILDRPNHAEFLYTDEICGALKKLPSAQLDRDIPMKPIETTDRVWGIPKKQAVCPKCDYYLGNVSFLGDYKGKRITYCETCGQAIDWEGWDEDE